MADIEELFIETLPKTDLNFGKISIELVLAHSRPLCGLKLCFEIV